MSGYLETNQYINNQLEHMFDCELDECLPFVSKITMDEYIEIML